MVLGLAAGSAQADARSDYLVGLLGSSSSFRVRAQAALSLGRVESSPEVVDALKAALQDEHPGVRASAASSLERLADPSCLPELRAIRRDADGTVRRAVASAIRSLERVARTRPTQDAQPSRAVARARYYVGVGMPGTRDETLDANALAGLRQYLVDQVQAVDGVLLAPEDEEGAAAERVLRTRRLTGYFIDASIVRVAESDEGTSATVSVILGTYPGRDMRAMLQGRATVPGQTGPAARNGAIRGALRGATRRLGQAMEASARR
ncbi:MAG: HEAT repeat domain-containing protein [Myxococcota bacterium]